MRNRYLLWQKKDAERNYRYKPSISIQLNLANHPIIFFLLLGSAMAANHQTFKSKSKEKYYASHQEKQDLVDAITSNNKPTMQRLVKKGVEMNETEFMQMLLRRR